MYSSRIDGEDDDKKMALWYFPWKRTKPQKRVLILNNLSVQFFIKLLIFTANSKEPKFFDFRGTHIKHGAVRHKVWLQKINDSWYITGQQDLQTYYVETQPNPDVPQSSPPENSLR